MRSLALTTALISLFFATPAPAEPSTAYDILKKQRELRTGYGDLSATGVMMIQDATGRTQAQHEFRLYQIESAPNENILLRIVKPADLAGTALLTQDVAGAKEEQWLYLPSTKRSRRLVGKGRAGRFLGSDFLYEDLIPPRIEAYSHALIGNMPCGASSCYIIEQQSRDTASAYSKRIVRLRTDNFQTVSVDLYNRRGEFFKEARFENYTGDHWFPGRIVMIDKKTSKRTLLDITQKDFKAGVQAERFNPNNLDRP